MTGASVDVDRVALSHELGQLSELFVVQAGWWRHPEQKDECLRVARELAELSRAVLGTVDYVHAYERARAAEILLGHLEGARRLFHTILTPPQSGDPNDRSVQRP